MDRFKAAICVGDIHHRYKMHDTHSNSLYRVVYNSWCLHCVLLGVFVYIEVDGAELFYCSFLRHFCIRTYFFDVFF